MSISEKYELVRKIDAQRSLVRQKRLGREVIMHRMALHGPDRGGRTSQRSVASRLAGIDHPAVPHVIDFLQHRDDYCFLVTESSPTNRWQTNKPRKLLERLGLLGQVVEAIHTAHQLGIAHGNIDAQAWLIDQQGKARILDLGVQQLTQSEAVCDQLRRRDLECVLDLVESELQIGDQSQTPLADGLVAAEGSDAEACQLDTLRQIIKTHRTDNSAGFAEFAKQFQAWLAEESQAAEARLLTFSASDDEEDQASGARWVTLALMAACVTFFGVVAFVMSTVFWPQKSESFIPRTAAAESGANYEAVEPTVSDLHAVGAINQASIDTKKAKRSDIATSPAAVVKSESQPTVEPTSDSDKTAPRTADSAKLTSADLPMSEVAERAVPVEFASDTEPASNPFERLSAAIDLPATNVRQAVRLISLELGDDDPFSMQLLGGEGAFKQGEFRLESRSSKTHTWSALFEKATPITIARCRLVDGELEFQWSAEATDLPAATYLGNCLLVLESGEWRHTIALRTPQVLPAVHVDLERVRPQSMAIASMPNLDDVYVEFVPSAASLAEALPSNVMPARGGKIKVGLDAGRDSLLVLELESMLEKRRLRIQATARMSSKSVFVPIKKGAARKLRAQLQSTAAGLGNREAYVKTVKGEGSAAIKKRLNSDIKKLKSNLKKLTFFAESYAIAASAQLEFRIYRQVAEHELELARYSTSDE